MKVTEGLSSIMLTFPKLLVVACRWVVLVIFFILCNIIILYVFSIRFLK